MTTNRTILFSTALATLLWLAAATSHAADEKRGHEIARKVENANDGFKAERSTMEMTLINAHGDTTRRKMTSIVRETPRDGDKSKIEFEWPSDIKGTRMLTWTHKRADDDQWLYMPATKRVRRIKSRSKSGSFMGSEFAYEDLGSQEIEKFRHGYIADESLAGRPTWKLERIPVDKSSGYSKQIIWIDKAYMGAAKIDYYDRRGTLLKTATFSGYRKHGQFWRPERIEMVNHQTRKRSIIEWKSRKLQISIDEDAFDSDELAD